MGSRPFPFNYAHGMSTGGIFYYSDGVPNYFPLDAEDGDLIFDIGGHIDTIFCSASGLLLCQHRVIHAIDPPTYAVLNPFIFGSERTIEMPLHRHPVGTARALIVDRRGQDASRHVFHIVCAVPVENGGGYNYTFEVYSSDTRQWHYGDMIPNDFGRIRPNSGVSCGRKAYWLTTDTCFIVFYDVENHSYGHLNMPAHQIFQDQIVRNHSQLGMGDRYVLVQEEFLILVAATQAQVVVYTHRQGIWTPDFIFPFDSPQRPIPLRSQSRRIEVLFLHQQNLHICVNDWGSRRNASSFKMQFQPPVLDSVDDFVPHIVSLVLNPSAASAVVPCRARNK